jgi:hypothetical protein
MRKLSVSIVLSLLMITSLSAAKLPNVDAFGSSRGKGANESGVAAKAGAMLRSGSQLHIEPRLGVPTMLWADGAAAGAASLPAAGGSQSTEEAAARAHLGRYADIYGLAATDVSSAVLSFVFNTGKGPIVVKFHQQIGGIEIFREEINILMNQKLEAVALGGYISSVMTPGSQPGSLAFQLPEASVATKAIGDVTGAGIDANQLIAAGSHDGYDYFTLPASSGLVLDQPVRMKKVFFHTPEGLEAAYYVEVLAQVPSDNSTILSNNGPAMETAWYSYVISAVNGGMLFRKNLTEDAQSAPAAGATAPNPGGFSYRVWVDPTTGIPYDTPAGNAVHPKVIATPDGYQAPFLPTTDMTLSSIMFSQNDPWIAPGATETIGNNVETYLDLFGTANTATDGYGPTAPPSDPPAGDFRAQITAPGQFLHTHTPDANTALAEARQGSIQQLFYNINFLHDWYYDSGFTEAARNAQNDNYGRGGLAADSVMGEVQDFSGFSNANMSTPADGGRPRMQMYVFPSPSNVLDIQAPGSIAAKRNIGVSMSGPQTFDITADIVRATWNNSPAGTCAVTNAAALNGKIAMFDFDNAEGAGCTFSTKISRLTTTTSAVAILMDYTSAAATSVANLIGFNTASVKPFATISFNSAAPIKSELAVPNAVTARLYRAPDRDGAVDNQIVFHEWGHYLSNRLVANSAGLSTNHSRGMGEGWGDFSAMMLTVRSNDTATPSNATWNGAYALATYATSGVNFSGTANQGYYFGIRRYPYSTDMSINPLTFKHITNGVALPVGPPVAFGASGASNSEVHNTGEVWTTMLWECYASLLRDTQGANPRLTFDQAQDRMKQYLVASLSMTPSAPTFTEARDAVLAAAYATDAVDYYEFWAAYAKRGAGTGAVSPDRFSTTNAGVVESFSALPDVMYVSSTLDDSVASCDSDGSLDAGESGKLVVQIQNRGTSNLNNTTATVSSSTPGVTFPFGNTISFPASAPLEIVSGSVTVQLAYATAGIQQLDLQLTISDPLVTGTRSGTASVRGNTDTIPASSATDTVEPASTVWAILSNPTFGPVTPFSRFTVSPLAHRWHVGDPGAGSDEYLTSPVFTVDGSGSVNLQFDHQWAFEFDGGGNYDGGVVEFSVNGGAWQDMGAAGALPNGYNGMLLAYSGNVNPLAGRPAFVKSIGSQHTTLTKAIAPGSTVQVRFRSASDNAVGSSGWDIDNIAFTGVVETPFATLVADTGCTVSTTTALTSSANPSPYGGSITLTATVSGGPLTGTVTFFDGASSLGTVAVSSDIATLATSTLSVGNHNLSAHYDGDAGHAVSTSVTLAQSITRAATSITIVTSTGMATFSRPVTFTAAVSTLSGTPGGSITFYDGASSLGSVSITPGGTSITVSSLIVGAHSISATYNGNTSYAASSTTVSANVVIETAKSDFTAEGKSDIVLQNSSTSAVAAWQMNGSSIVSTNPVATPTADWKVVATGDLEGDGKADLILQNSTTGVVAEWRMNGLTMMSGANITTASTQQRIVGTYDFNHDGKADIVLQNTSTLAVAIWQMNGSTIAAAQIVATPAAGWKAIAAGNIGGDAIVLQNTGSGDVARWLINGFTLTGGTPIGTAASSKLIGLGDFNTDGVDDLLFQSPSTNAVSIWRLNSSAAITGAMAIATPAAGVTVLGAADYDGNGRSDILLQNTSSNGISMWQTDGNTLLSGAVVATPVAGWKPVVN